MVVWCFGVVCYTFAWHTVDRYVLNGCESKNGFIESLSMSRNISLCAAMNRSGDDAVKSTRSPLGAAEDGRAASEVARLCEEAGFAVIAAAPTPSRCSMVVSSRAIDDGTFTCSEAVSLM